MSHSTPASDDPPATSRAPWRAAVIGIVAVLAVAIGLAVGSFLATARVAAIGAAAEYVPSTAPFYVELQLEPSAEQDAAARELLSRFPAIDGVDVGRPLADQLAELLDRALAEDDLDLSWSEDIGPWTDGRVAMAMLDLPPSAMDPMADPMAMADAPPMVIMLGVTDASAARTTVARVLDEADAPDFTTSEHLGISIHASVDGEGAYAITDDQLIVAASADDIVAALDAASTGATLADRDDIASLVSALPDDWLAFGILDFTGAMQSALEAAGEQSSASAAAMARLLDHQSMRAAFTVSAGEDGLHFDAAGSPPTGPFSVDTADRGLAAEVPADTLMFSEGGPIGPALAEIIGAIKEVAADEPEAADSIRTAEAALGADLEEIVAWIDDGAMAIGWDGTEVYGGLVLVPSDRAAAARRFDQLSTFARLAAMDPSTGVSVDERTVAGVDVVTLHWEDASAGMMGVATSVSVQYALTDDRVLIGFGERFVGRALELDEAGSLASVARYTDAVAALGGPSAAGIAWLDVTGVVSAAEAALGPMLEDEADDVMAWLRPFDRLVAVGRLEGEVLVQRSVLLVR